MTVKSPEFVYICDPPSKNAQGSLSGLRLGVKDLFHIAGIPTGAGNPEWLSSHHQPADVTSPVVSALLQAGATLLGKTLTDELAYSLEGLNQHYGTPTNPKAPNRIPGGSSSGSAVAVANGSIDIGLGTDTGGSIRVPASYNGLYGFRPSHGAISCKHLVALSPRFDTVGWLTRDLPTMKQVAEVLLPASTESSLSHLVVCNIEGVESWKQARQQLLKALTSQFLSVKYIDLSDEQLTKASAAFRVLQGREIWRVHGPWIEQQQPNFASDISDRFTWCKSLREIDEEQAEISAQEFVNFWHSHVLPSDNHVLIIPTTPGAAPLLDMSASAQLKYRNRLLGLTAPAGLTESPQINLPYLESEQAPWGVSLLARSSCDRSLLTCVHKLDKIFKL
ncbi:amidase [Pleurocapsa sp. PCC 7319]|uniref:amidase n=1 Tax=Pleurocapsa sp. PCC 7319 TaxID=118161 RepID=UPI00034C1171|nr:amidase [Pleurocapsa sp. PCC 7319]